MSSPVAHEGAHRIPWIGLGEVDQVVEAMRDGGFLVKRMNRWEWLWSRLVGVITPYLVSPIGRPTKPRAITYFAATRPRRLLSQNRYPRQIIGIGIRLPDMHVRIQAHPRPETVCHPVLSIVWAKPHGAGRWKR